MANKVIKLKTNPRAFDKNTESLKKSLSNSWFGKIISNSNKNIAAVKELLAYL